MDQTIDAIYENGTFRPVQPDAVHIPEGQRVRVTISDAEGSEALRLAAQVYEGLSEREIDEIEQIALDRSRFFGPRSAD